jgi:signal transduction histidine kinase
MESRDTPEVESRRALAALLHRVASPLGAVVNYAYLLPASEDAEARTGVLEAAARTQDILSGARRWLDALATLDATVPAGGVDPAGILRRACAEADGEVELRLEPLPRVAAPSDALARIAAEIVANAVAAADEVPAQLAVALGAEAGVHLCFADGGRGWSQPPDPRVFELFGAPGSGSNAPGVGLAIVGSLTRSLGGRAWAETRAGGGALIHVVLPPGDAKTAAGRSAS